MLIDILMPKMGESIMEGTILKWLKKAGEKIERDEPILEISTDKVDTEVPSPESGILAEILFKEGDVVEVGKVIARIETDISAEVKSAVVEEQPVRKEESIPIHEPEVTKAKAERPAEKDKGRFYSPLVMNIAQKEGIGFEELEKIQGTGIESRVTKKDILEYIKTRSSAPKKEEIEEVPVVKKETEPEKPKKEKIIEVPKQKLIYDEEGTSVFEFDNIRQKMAEHMVASASTSPHVNSFAECDMTAVEKARNALKDEFEKRESFKLTYMPFICEAVIKALKDFPLVNSVIDNSTVPYKAVTKSRINLGFAVAMDNGGLIVPVIKDADTKNITGLAREIYDLAKRARIKKLTLDEIQDGTFTISNFGVFGNTFGTMIINQPQIAILGIGAVKKRPTVLETEHGDFVVIKPIMFLSLSFDHRLIDGALGGSFVMRVAHYLENYSL